MDTPSDRHVMLYYRLTYGEAGHVLVVHLSELHERNYVEGLIFDFVGEEPFVIKDIDHCIRNGYVRGMPRDSSVTLDICNGMVRYSVYV